MVTIYKNKLILIINSHINPVAICELLRGLFASKTKSRLRTLNGKNVAQSKRNHLNSLVPLVETFYKTGEVYKLSNCSRNLLPESLDRFESLDLLIN